MAAFFRALRVELSATRRPREIGDGTTIHSSKQLNWPFWVAVQFDGYHRSGQARRPVPQWDRPPVLP
jgi:hypothetical protein